MAIDFTAKNPVVMGMDSQITITVIVASVLLTPLLVFLLTMPINNKYKKHQSRLKLIRSVNLNAINGMQEEEKRLKIETDRISSELAYLEQMLSQQKDVSNLIDSFVETAEERNLTFDSLQPLPSNIIHIDVPENDPQSGRKGRTAAGNETDEDKPVFSETVIQIELTASFNDFLTFLWETENLDKTLRVKYLSVLPSGRPEIYKYNIVISVLKYLNKEKSDEA